MVISTVDDDADADPIVLTDVKADDVEADTDFVSFIEVEDVESK